MTHKNKTKLGHLGTNTDNLETLKMILSASALGYIASLEALEHILQILWIYGEM